jgi:ZIP family zinc transporter
VLAAVVLLILNAVVARLRLRWPRLRRMIEGSPTLLVLHGEVLTEHLRREGLDQETLEAALREHGVADVHDVEMAVLEIDGSIIITVAVISHDFADGINTVTVMMNSGNSVKSSLRMLLLDAIAPVLGATSTLLIVVPDRTLVYILPFFAGGFLYLGASDLLPEAHERNPPAVSLVLSLAGFLLIFVITRFLNV